VLDARFVLFALPLLSTFGVTLHPLLISRGFGCAFFCIASVANTAVFTKERIVIPAV
jgi:hypothetical protein